MKKKWVYDSRFYESLASHEKAALENFTFEIKNSRIAFKLESKNHGKFNFDEDLDEALKKIAEFEFKNFNEENILETKPSNSPQHLPCDYVPGFGLRDFLGHFSRRDFRERIIEATHAELVAEYEETLASGNEERARIQKRMIYVWLLWATFRGVLAGLLSKLSFKFVSSPD